MKLIMMSDTHYISRRSCTADAEIDTLNDIAVTEQALRQAAEDGDTIIITGDLTDSGDSYSHEDLAEILRGLKAQGKRIFVIFATHDYRHQKAFVRMYGDSKLKYKSEPWNAPYFEPENEDFAALLTDDSKRALGGGDPAPKLIPALTDLEIWNLYKEFGPDEAYSSYAQEYCYCVDLDENTRCLMLNDIFRNVECADISASFSPGCFKWIKQMVVEAERDGKAIFACSHHPIKPIVSAHRLGASVKNLRTPYTGHTLADIGVKLIFVGHTHASDISFMRSDKGNTICSVMTPSVRFYPPQYRIVDFDGANHKISYESVNVRKPQNVDCAEDDLNKYYFRRMYDDYYRDICGKNTVIAKRLRTLKIGDLYFLVRGNAKLTKAEYEKIKDIKIFDYIINLAFNMLDGKRLYTPDSPEYKFGVALAALAESVINAQPFKDIRKKSLQGYTMFDIIEDLLCTDGADNVSGEIDYTKIPAKPYEPKRPVSHAGEALMAILFAVVCAASPLMPPAAIIAFAAKLYGKQKLVKSEKPAPLMRY